MTEDKETVFIYGGRVVDPSQDLDCEADILCEAGSIKEIYKSPSKELRDRLKGYAQSSIDASGRIVSPGFVDIHMHEDPLSEKSGRPEGFIGECMLRMGVTTVLGGNCGDNYGDPIRYLDSVESCGAPVNIALLAGHSFLRRTAGAADKFGGSGIDKYHPVTEDILKNMEAYGRECLEAGCYGISFGVKYVPGADWREISGLASLCHRDDRLVTSHVRNDVDGVFDACDELMRMGRDAGVRVQFSHIGSMGGYGQMPKLLSQIESYRRDGIDMMCDCYPYDAFSTNIGETTYDDGFLQSYKSDYSHIELCDGPYAGQRCTEEIFHKLRREAPETLTVGYFMREDDVDLALMSSFVMLGSDGILSGRQGHPRAAGSFPRFISRFVRTGKLSMSEAINKMSCMAAKRIGLKAKGSLRPGADADIVIFDPERIEDRATYAEPLLPPVGIDRVLIGGRTALLNGEVQNSELGRALRFGRN